MSVEAISWALNLAPVPTDAGGRRNPACKAVLVGLANHADPSGRDAFPSVRTLMRYTELSERTVRTALDRLEAAGVITSSDPAVIAAKIKRGGYRPQGWDLAMRLVRDDLDDDDLHALDGQFPGLAERVAPTRATRSGVPVPAPAPTGHRSVMPAAPPATDPADPVENTPPFVDNSPGRGVDDAAREVQLLHPCADQGCNHRMGGVQLFPIRGAVVAPEPSLEPSVEPSTAWTGPSSTVSAVVDDGEPAVAVAEFFAVLDPVWSLSVGQRARLAPRVAAAIGVGWRPDQLAAFVGANTFGVRSPYAVLTARLAPGELPDAPSSAKVAGWPPWCGNCAQGTRRLEHADGSDAGRCPRCHPALIASRSGR